MGVGEQAAAALRKRWRSFRERGEIPQTVGYGLPTALIVLALFWPFLYGVVPSRDNLCGNQAVSDNCRMVRGYERYYRKASTTTRDPELSEKWSPSLDMDALGLRAKWWRGPYEGPDGNNPSAPVRGADAPFQPPQEAIELGNTTYADRVAAWAYSYDCALFEQAFSVIFRNDTGLDFPGVGRTCNHRHLLAHMAKECEAGRCPKMKVAGAPVDSMLVALGVPGGPEWGINEDDDNFESLYTMHFLTAVVSGIGCLLFFRLYSDAIKQPEFFAGGPYRWYVAAVGAYFYCQLAVNFVVFAAFVDTRCKHHNILVVNRVDYTGLDFCALAGVEADASCGYGSATSPACAAGAQSLRPLRWAKKGAAFQGPTAWLGDSGWRQFFPWWLSVFFLKERSSIMREKPGDGCLWYDDVAGKERDCDAWWTPGFEEATYAACAVVNGVDRKQLFIDDGTARWAVVHRWGALYVGGMFTNVLLQAILYLRAAMLRGLAGRSDSRLMAAIRVFIALECVGLVVLAYFMYDIWVATYAEYDVDDPNFRIPEPPPHPWGSIILYGTMIFFGGGHMFVTVALVYVFVAAMRRASAGLRAEGADADDETRDILRQQKRTVARVVAASVMAIMSTFVTYLFPMIYGYLSPNFWRKRSMIFLVTFIVDSVVNDLCLMAVAFVDVKEDEKTSAAAVPIQPAPDFDKLSGFE